MNQIHSQHSSVSRRINSKRSMSVLTIFSFLLLLTLSVFSADSLEKTIRDLAVFGSRIPGYAGSEKAEDYLFRAFEEIGLENVSYESFEVGVPIDEGALIEFGDQSLPLRCLWPNGLRTPTLPKDGLNGNPVYCRRGEWADLRGQDLDGAIVLLDFDCGNNWLRVFELGARAVIFAMPETTTRQEAEEKFASVPIHAPRFWADGAVAEKIRAYATPPNIARPLRCRISGTMTWRNVRARNVLAGLEGTEERALRAAREQENGGKTIKADPNDAPIDYVVLSAPFDSISVVPSLAPGAENACSIAGLLEIARHLKANPPKRSVVFVATNAHFLGLNGAGIFTRDYELAMRRDSNPTFRSVNEVLPDLARRAQAENVMQPLFPNYWIEGAKSNTFFVGLDLSSRSKLVGVFARGGYEDQRDIVRNRRYSPVGHGFKNAVRELLQRDANADVSDVFADTINPVMGKDADSYFPRLPVFESEIANFQMPGVTLATCSDNREKVNTPFDTPDRVNFDNLRAQIALLAPLLARVLDDEKFTINVNEDERPEQLIFGRVVEFDSNRGFTPDAPVPNAVVVALRARGEPGEFLHGFSKPLFGVHVNDVTVTDAQGRFSFLGLQWRDRLRVEAVGFDANGEIVRAPDLGKEGDKKHHFRDFAMTDQGGKPLHYVVFPCVAISILDLFDPRNLVTFEGLRLIDANTGNAPHSFGTALPPIPWSDPANIESATVLFVRRGASLKLTMRTSESSSQLALLNVTDKRPAGEGFAINESKHFRHAKALIARDLWKLDDARLKKLSRYGIRVNRLDEIHEQAQKALTFHEAAVAKREWGVASEQAERALALESSIYPEIVKTANDVVWGVLFYLVMVIPFAYLLERLLFAHTSYSKQIGTVALLWIAVMGILFVVHPAFSISLTPFLIFLALIILALATVVIGTVMLRFQSEIKAIRGGPTGVHGVDVNRLSALGAAFLLGIGNMRRSKIRTATTCMTIILLTFTVLSFTSQRTYIRYDVNELPWKAGFEGIFFRSLAWSPLQNSQAERFVSELGGKFDLVPRSWHVSRSFTDALVVEARNATDPSQFTQFNALVGLTANEPKISKADEALVAGRWFEEGDHQACMISEDTAQLLGISREDVKADKQPAVSLFGAPMRVVGVFDSKKMDAIQGITTEPLTPVNFQVYRANRSGAMESEDSAAALTRKYVYHQSQTCAFVPHEWLLANGGTLRAIGAIPKEKVDLEPLLRDLMQRWAVTLTAGISDKSGKPQAFLFSSRGATAIGMDIGLLPALLIGFLIVFATMMGSFYERIKEIAIYSSVGLSPLHIAVLFVAEAAVYATIGSVAGYLLGQVTASVLLHYELLGGLTLNYSSSIALVSILLVIGVVLLSSLYPAYKAMRLASPDYEAQWSLGEPVGDTWKFRLPFQVRRDFGMAMSEFIAQFFDMHDEQAIGVFTTENVRSELRGTKGYGIYFKCWLAPFEKGICQHIALETVPTEDDQSFEFLLTITRFSGDVALWRKSNARFLKLIRKQFLIWRTIGDDARDEYQAAAEIRMGQDMLAGAETIARPQR